MPRRAFIFCWRFILLAAAATAFLVGLPFLDAVFAAPRAVAFFAGFLACEWWGRVDSVGRSCRAFFLASFWRIATSSSSDMSTFFSTSVIVEQLGRIRRAVSR